jgi:hypothetical protein
VWSAFATGAGNANIDARFTGGGGGFYENGDSPLAGMFQERQDLLVAVPNLEHYEPGTGRPKIGEAYALIAYIEVLAAEDYCAGVPLSVVLPKGGFQYGTPLTTDSLLAVAESHFDSAVANANGSDTVMNLARVGLARARLDRGDYVNAALPAHRVPTGFVYNTQNASPPNYSVSNPFNLYQGEFASSGGCPSFNVGEREGGTGLNFVSARDPRVVLDTTQGTTCDGGTWYYPMEFGEPPTGLVPLATGIEARLIEAEAALHGANAVGWAAALNALRADSTDTKVVFASALSADSTTAATQATQADIMFRERAFWLFGTGTRLGDLRRLVRQYGRDPNTVFPSGAYVNGADPHLPHPLPNYGTDVSLTLPTPAGSLQQGAMTANPSYRGCLSHAA